MEEFNENVAQEMAMHIALCVCSDYTTSWGLAEFLEKLSEYCEVPELEHVKRYAKKLEEE